MDIKPRIELLPEKKLIGRRLKMSLSNNRTFELWNNFMPIRKKIKNTVGNNLFSMQVYDSTYNFQNFNPEKEFEKWAAVEVSDFKGIPEGMEPYTLKGGLYAVFIHRGSADTGHITFQYIFGSWLPQSEYELDQREHFELLGDKYKNNDPASEEEIWIPVRLRKMTSDI